MHRAWRSVREDGLGASRCADFVKGVDQGGLVVRLEREVEVDGSVERRGAEGLPVGRDGIPFMFDTHVIPTWCNENSKVGKSRRGGENREHRELAEAHDQRPDKNLRRLEMQSARAPEH